RVRLHDERRRVAASAAGASDRRAAAADQRARVEAQSEDAPPGRPGRPAARPDGHAPLWACVDFAGDLDPAARAGLEAALEASGLLDALVAPGGDLLDGATLDTWIRVAPTPAGACPTGPALAGLVPVPGGPVPEDAVGRALAGIAAASAVSPDGRWRVGPLHGRWSKDTAEYVGATARSEARRRRIGALTAEIEALDATLGDLAAEDRTLVAELARIDDAERAWPSPDRLRDAAGAVDRALAAVAAAGDALSTADARLAQARADGQAAVEGLRRAEDAAGCPAADAEDAVTAVHDYREALATVVADAERALDRRAAAEGAGSRAGSAAAEADVSEADAAEARVVAATARGEADELRTTVGADAEAVLARQAALTADLERARGEHEQLAAERDTASRQESAAAALLEQTEAERVQREAERADALARLAGLAATELARLALGPVPDDRDLAQVTAGLAFARAAYDKLRDVDFDQRTQDGVSNRFHNGFTVLRSELGVEFDPYLDTSDGLEVCYATLNGAVVGLTDLSATLDDQIRRRREALSAEERQLIERHLLTEIGTHLGDRVHAAWDLTRRMNQQLAEHGTRGGVTLRLSWQISPDAGPGAEEAMKLLRQNVGLLDQTERATLAAFLQERVRAARDAGEGTDVVERLATALDYRTWHHFTVHLRSADGRERRMTAHTYGAGSGGEQAKLAHLPLFAATAAYYTSARADAPHLLMLDEAFAGIDDSQRGDCMGMLVELDLDMVVTNYAEWGCYPEVPAVAVYHLERTPGRPGAVALRFVWDGTARREDDPWLDSRVPPERGLFA
ncbi:MAG: TIGR02680 family protein, partial [Acidimicrobiales bacterium]